MALSMMFVFTTTLLLTTKSKTSTTAELQLNSIKFQILPFPSFDKRRELLYILPFACPATAGVKGGWVDFSSFVKEESPEGEGDLSRQRDLSKN